MKKFNRIVIALIMFCGLYNAVSAQEKTAVVWKEKDDFHKVMAATFHPMEDGNFKPIHERAGELAMKALAWKKSTPPKEMSSPEISKKLDELVSGANDIEASVKKNIPDAELQTKLNALHGVFHSIIGLCMHEKE